MCILVSESADSEFYLEDFFDHKDERKEMQKSWQKYIAGEMLHATDHKSQVNSPTCGTFVNDSSSFSTFASDF
jgi:hypothetical protein